MNLSFEKTIYPGDILYAIDAVRRYYKIIPYESIVENLCNDLEIILDIQDNLPGGGAGNIYYDRLLNLHGFQV